MGYTFDVCNVEQLYLFGIHIALVKYTHLSTEQPAPARRCAMNMQFAISWILFKICASFTEDRTNFHEWRATCIANNLESTLQYFPYFVIPQLSSFHLFT